ncbi:hypothetical protein D3C72_2106490 [compost metagenome]
MPAFLQQLFALARGLAVLLVVVIEARQPQPQRIVRLQCQRRLVAGDGTGPVGLLGLDVATQAQQLKLLLLRPLFIGQRLLDVAARLRGLLQVGRQGSLQLSQPGPLGI